MFLTTYLYLNN